jgi:hypothetical protein
VRSRFAALSFALLMLAAWPVAGQSITADPPESALALPASPDKGSALVTADPGACARSSTLTLATVTRGLTRDGRPSTGRSAVASSRVGATCRWRIDGLGPGEYEVDLWGPGGSGGVATVMAAPGALREVQVPAPTVRVTGTIRVNGTAVERARLLFAGRASQAGGTRVETDAAGRFDVTLARPGDYRVFISGDSVFSQSTAASFDAGDHEWETNIVGGVVTVEVIPSSSGGNLEFYFEKGDGSFWGGAIPNARTRLVRRGVLAGTYHLSLKRNGQRVSDAVTVTIDGDRSTADVVLREVVR